MVKKVLAVLMVVALWAGVSYAKDYEVKKTAGANTVVVKIDKNPPVVGENNITVEVADNMGKYVKDAKVSVAYGMPAMSGMPAMNYKAELTPKGNGYAGVLNISMAGSWNVNAKVTVVGKTHSVKFTVDAQ